MSFAKRSMVFHLTGNSTATLAIFKKRGRETRSLKEREKDTSRELWTDRRVLLLALDSWLSMSAAEGLSVSRSTHVWSSDTWSQKSILNKAFRISAGICPTFGSRHLIISYSVCRAAFIDIRGVCYGKHHCNNIYIFLFQYKYALNFY